ncbi:stage V sporulation protein AA [Serpentinicella sp. ANB-PHB4]|uniref:stage V sporulation protein AA n=1 Tax=Serpentinicella sp. ANB-PHB4 TaxID=3074076 RepID=UPI00285CCF2E|nr:stage V sporulation protein AA [Serpentinicella sp. ANB-PHB4]MDR5660057.1 stage V sporulation protein AA [Serpentinicella sp. ANB-PHB4]
MKDIYIQSKGKVYINENERVYLKDLVYIDVNNDSKLKVLLDNIEYEIQDTNADTYIIPIIKIINTIVSYKEDLNINVLGEPEVIINKKDKDINSRKYTKLKVALVCFILFIGSITAIINFHSDVNMKDAHRTIYKVITGQEQESLLLLQIPYSIGIGVGMSVFFNHVFKKRINREPSPLEVEMFLYQQNMDEYNKNNKK